MTGMRDVLARISVLVEQANQDYNSTDHHNAGLFQ